MNKREKNKIPVLSFFSGCGGMDLGFEIRGFLPIIAIDNDKKAVETYNKNRRRETALFGDLSKLTGRDIIKLFSKKYPGVSPKGVIGGPPCQSFSQGNVYGKENDKRHHLPIQYAEILKTLNKKYHLDFFLFENVVGLKSNKHKKHFNKILRALEDADFNLFEQELNASWFCVPQNRRRIFVVGINKQLYPQVDFKIQIDNNIQKLTVRDTIHGLPEPEFFKRKLRPEDIPFHPNHWTMNPRSPKFGNRNNKNGRSFRKLKWGKPSWTVAYGNREIHVHPNGRRRLSIFEAMLLQGFPQSYELLGNLSQQVTQISDAVPPPLSKAIAIAILATIYEPREKIQKLLLDWFKTNQRHFHWRETSNPYFILVAEKLLQQTLVNDNVVNAYQKIITTYPDLFSLAKAKTADICPIFEPLGFIYRAKELPILAQDIIQRFDGKVPDNLKDLKSIPGVGDYIARAVLCFGFGQASPIVDTNVARFLYRVFGIYDPLPTNPARNQRLITLANNLIPQKNIKEFNLAILDLCAKVCTPNNPNCLVCPIQKICEYGRSK